MRIREFAFDRVKITEPVLVNAYEKEQEYLRSLEPDRLLAGFSETAGLPKRADRYPGGWENSELSGHTLGHYMVAMAQLYAATKAEDIKERLDYVLEELSVCQAGSGYLFTSDEEIFNRIEEGGLAWMPWYTMHKLMTGLLAVYRLAELPKALEIAKKLGRWICNRVLRWTDKQRRKALCIADGGMNDCLYEMYKETGDAVYLEAAAKFDDPELYRKIAEGKDILPNKHANNTIPKFLGALNRYMALGESEDFYLEAAEAFFDMVEKSHTYITGGNGELEHFRTPGALGANRTQCNCETCSSYNMLKLAERLYTVTGKKRYMDYYERTLMNAILGSQNPEDGMTAFFQPMEPGYFKTFGTPYSNFWCCTGTGMESFTKLNRGVYHSAEDKLYVNRYISSELTAEEFGGQLTQTVAMEAFDEASFSLKSDDLKQFTLCLRIPEWAGDEVSVTVNGATVPCEEADGYLMLDRTWNDGDRVVLKLFPKVKVHSLSDMQNCVAATYGPFVLAAGLGRADMTTERLRTKVVVPTKKIPVRDRIMLKDEQKLTEWFAHCNDNFVKQEGELAFSLLGTDVDGELVFEPYYKKYDERYGVYFEYHDAENLPPDLRAKLEEQKRIEEERKAAEEERLRQEAEAEAERLRLEAEEEAERRRLEAEVEAERLRLVAAAEAERQRREAEAEAERLRKEEEEAERRRLEEEERKRREEEEAERRRLEEEERQRREAEEEAERQRLAEEEEERQIVDEAKRLAAQKVAEVERAAELAEAKVREEEAKLKAAQLEAERAEAEAVAKKAQTEQAEAEAATLKAQAEIEAAKAAKAEDLARQAKADKEASKASKKAAKKKRKRYREFSVGKLLAWIGGVLVIVVLLYLFATPVSKAFFTGKDAVDTFLAEKLPKVADFLKVKGNGDAMPVFKAAGGTVYLTEDAEGLVKATTWPQGCQASVVRLSGKQYICIEGNGLKTYYLNEIAENDSKHVYLETETEKALYFWDYSFEQPERLCPIAGEFNTSGVKQYVINTLGAKNAFHVLDAATLEEHKVLLQAETAAQILAVDAYVEEEQNIRIDLTAGETAYSFAVPKKAGAVLPDGYKIGLEGVSYIVNGAGIRFEAYVVSADAYLGKLIGTLNYSEQVYEVDRFDFYAYAGDTYENGDKAAVLEAVTLNEAREEHMEVSGDRGERLLVPVRADVKRYEYDAKSFLTEKNGEISYIRDGKTVSVKGVDVSRNQGTIDWDTVVASGAEYAMIRLGIREDEKDGKCKIDGNYSRNVKGALKAGLEAGIYFTSRATTEKEAQEEAQFVLKNIKDYDITWPVAIDTVEDVGAGETRASKLSAEERTACVKAFMDEIAAAGYTPVLYTNARWSALKLDLSELSTYDVWYSSKGELSEYPYHYTMWQYTDGIEVPGINGTADLSISFVDYGEAKRQEQ